MAHLEAEPTKAFPKHRWHTEQSHCPDHKWASAREVPGEKSIFCPWSKKDELVDVEKSTPRSYLGEETMRFREQHVAESIRNSGLETSHQMEALNLQSVSKNVSQMCCMKRTHFIEEGQDETPSLVQEMASLIVEWCDAFLERINENDLAEGCEEAPEEPSMMASGSEAEADARQSELTQDSIKPARKPRANSKEVGGGVVEANGWKEFGQSPSNLPPGTTASVDFTNGPALNGSQIQ